MSDKPEQTIVERLFRNAERYPDKTAIVVAKSVIKYRQLAEHICGAAALLREQGVKPLDRVLFSALYSPSYIYVYFATHLLGAVAVPFDPQTPDEKRKTLLTILQPALSVVRKTSPEESNTIPLSAFDEVTSPATNLSFPSTQFLADILFTTGTSGTPKGVELSHSNLIAAADNINTFIGNTPEEREVIPLPLHHSFGLGRLRCNMSKGSTVIQANGFMFVKSIFDLLEQYEATGFCFVPAGCAILFNVAGDKLGEYSKQLKYIEIGSAPMPLENKRRLMRLLPKTRICMHYGLTEASRSTFIEFHSADERITSIGQATPGVTIGILNEQGEQVDSGESGEVCIRGNHVMKSYFRNEEETKNVFHHGWLRTGDIGYQDKDEYIFIQGRAKDIINIGGKKVSPIEVEEALKRHPAIQDCACIGVPDPEGISGETVKAFLVSREEKKPELNAIGFFLGDKLEPYKLPTQYEWIDEIPKTASGKVLRQTLKDRAITQTSH